MSDLGWRAQSSQLARQAKPIEGLREDFGVRVRAAVEALKEEKSSLGSEVPRGNKGKLIFSDKNLPKCLEQQPSKANKGVEARAAKDRTYLETADDKERKRIATLERKAALYERLQRGVDLGDEAANDLHEVDFIAKALNQPEQPGQEPLDTGPLPESAAQRPPSLHPEDFLRQQQAIKEQMQGGKQTQYSTYEEDVAELEARHRKVDELDALNAERNAEFAEARKRKAARQEAKDKELAKQKNAILQHLMRKRQKLKS